MTSHGSDTFTWYTYDLPKKLAAGTRTSEFFYGTDRQRYKQVQKTGSTTNATIYYVGTLFEKEVAGSTTTYRHYVSTQDRAVATVSRVGSTNTTQYLHRDHQGSVVEITSASGTLVQSLAYDAWGVRRSPATWAALGSPFAGSESLERGYTGHEHLDRVELIHMNGRVQDPRLGRFISADPTVPQPFDSQSYDRYSYVRNRPTTLVDPSGFTPCLDDFSCFDPGVDIGAGYGGRFSGWRPGAGLTISIPCEAVALCGPGVKDSSTPAGFDPLAVGTVAAIGSQAADVIRLPPFSWGALGQWGSRVAWPAAVIGSIIFPNKLGNGECIGNPVCEEQIRQMMEGQQDSPPTTDAGDNLETTPMSGDPNRQDDDRDDDVSEPGSKFPNRLVRRTTEEIRQGFEQRGFERSQSGRAELWTKGDRRYVIRPSGSRGTKIDAYKLDEFGEFRKLGEFIPK
jgi:RHS repeat-associated protein